MSWIRGWLPLVFAGAVIAHAGAATPMPTLRLTNDAAAVYEWLVHARDHQDLPFMIIDKHHAHLWVFDRAGQLLGDAPVLLGSARGDHTAPGVGDKQLSAIPPEDRTTPAGRFVAEPGRNARGEEVVWVDYESGVSMHRVLTNNARERRVERLATPTPADNRVSFGCINVPQTFFDTVVLRTAGTSRSVVYILPDKSTVHAVFGPKQAEIQVDTARP